MESLWQTQTVEDIQEAMNQHPLASEYVNRMFQQMDHEMLIEVFADNPCAAHSAAEFLFACGQEWDTEEHPLAVVVGQITGSGLLDIASGPESVFKEVGLMSSFEEAVERARCLFVAMTGIPALWTFDNDFEEDFPVKP